MIMKHGYLHAGDSLDADTPGPGVLSGVGQERTAGDPMRQEAGRLAVVRDPERRSWRGL